MEFAALTESVYYILLALSRPKHGYGIMQEVEAMSGGRVRLAPGTLYGALETLVKKEWITPLPGEGRKKEYMMTKLGKEVLSREILRLRELLENGEKYLEGER